MTSIEKEIERLKAYAEVDKEYLGSLKAEVISLKKEVASLKKTLREFKANFDDFEEAYNLQKEVFLASFDDIYDTLYPEDAEEEEEEEEDLPVEESDSEEEGDDDEEEKDPVTHSTIVSVHVLKPTTSSADEKKASHTESNSKLVNDIVEEIVKSTKEVLNPNKEEPAKEEEDSTYRDTLDALGRVCDTLKDLIKNMKD